MWSIVSGKIKDETPEECLLREVLEETGLDVEIIKSQDPEIMSFGNKEWFTYRFLCLAKSKNVILNSEHTGFC